MRAVHCIEHAAHVVDIATPSGPGVRVRIASAGICGSDLHLLDTPLIAGTMGHEFAGWLDDGTPVAVEPIDACGECAPCLDGAYHLCTRGPGALIGVGRDGGMAEQCIVPASAIVALPTGLSPTNGSLVEPLAVVMHGLRRAGFTGRERVAIVGAGTIGLCAVACARHAGCTPALLSRHEFQRAAGERLGAVGASGSYDIVIEAVGTSAALQQATELTRPGGRVLVLGVYWEGMQLQGLDWSLREITLIPAYLYGRDGTVRDFERAVEVLAATPALPGTLITHRFPLDAAAEAFRVARDRAAGAIKVVLEP